MSAAGALEKADGVTVQAANRALAQPLRPQRMRVPGFAYLSVAPTLLVVAIVVGGPLVYSFYLSLHRTNPITKKWLFVGFGNYAAAIANADFWAAIGRTVYFAGFTLVGSTLLGLAMALVLNQRFVGRGLLRSFVLVPWAMAPVSVGVLWSFIYAGDYGALTGLLDDLGLGRYAMPWLGDGFRALNLVALTQVWSQAPLTALMLLAGLQSMPDSLRRAAMLDGAGPVARFFAITLPWLKPSLLFISIVTTINSLMAFDILWIMTRGGPGAATTVLSWLGYVTAFQFLRFGEGASLLYFLTALSFLLAIVYFVVFSPRRSVRRAPSAAVDEALPALLAARVRKPPALPASLGAYRVRRALPAPLSRALGNGGFALLAVVIFLWSALPVLALVLMSLTPASDLIRTPPTLVPSTITLQNFQTVLLAGVGRAVLDKRAGEAGSALDLQQLRRGRQRFVDLRCAGHFRRLRLRPLWQGQIFSREPLGAPADPHDSGADPRAAVLHLLPHAFADRHPHRPHHRLLVFPAAAERLDDAQLFRGRADEPRPRGADGRMLVVHHDDARAHPGRAPGIVAAIIFCFLASWNEFLFALILTSTPNAQTIPVVISGLPQPGAVL